MGYTINGLNGIFYSGGQVFRADQQAIHDIKFLIDQGMLLVERKQVMRKKSYSDQIDKVQKNRHAFLDFEGGDIGHIALKVVAYDFLLNNGYTSEHIRIEHDFMGYRPDLMTIDNKVLIECGNTETSKIFKYFQNPDTKELIIIPYPEHDDKKLSSFHFTPGDDLVEFLKFSERESVRKTGQLLNR